jgi:hypothetical protein
MLFSRLKHSSKGYHLYNLSSACPEALEFFIDLPFVSSPGWVAGAQRMVEVYRAAEGFRLKVEGCGEYFVLAGGESFGKLAESGDLSQLDRETLLGPVFVLALALRGTWSLHASAARFQEKTIIFLGESGQGKSTLAAYLSQSAAWRRVADDILPVTDTASGLTVWPHFPQLKLSPENQPWIGLPEHLPLDGICVLEAAGPEQEPELHRLAVSQAAQAFIGHIAGTRLFPPELLKKHLGFSAQAAAKVPAYRLVYPHRRETLPQVQELLEKLTGEL